MRRLTPTFWATSFVVTLILVWLLFMWWVLR
jgi:hypothetical protein